VVISVERIDRAMFKELAHRATSFVEVALLWRRQDGSLKVRLTEIATGVEFEFAVPPEAALEAFNHPYAYLPRAAAEPTELLAA
jgi:hypothetical protein